MSITIDDPETVAAIRRLAEQDERTVAEVLQDAVKRTIERREEAARRRAILTELQDRFARLRSTGLQADKAFFDELSGDL